MPETAAGPSDHWADGAAYDHFMGRWSARIAPLFLDALGQLAGRRWLDIGCGTGVLTSAILEQMAPASVVGVEPSAEFRATAVARFSARGEVEVLLAGAESLPLADASVDVAVSGLVLNFVENPAVGVAEMVRVTAPDGVIGAYIWDFAGGIGVLNALWDAAVSVDPDGAGGLDEAVRFAAWTGAHLGALFEDGTGAHAEVSTLEATAEFASFDDYWNPVLQGTGPGPAWVAALDEERREQVRRALLETLPLRADRGFDLPLRAWCVTVDLSASR